MLPASGPGCGEHAPASRSTARSRSTRQRCPTCCASPARHRYPPVDPVRAVTGANVVALTQSTEYEAFPRQVAAQEVRRPDGERDRAPAGHEPPAARTVRENARPRRLGAPPADLERAPGRGASARRHLLRGRPRRRRRRVHRLHRGQRSGQQVGLLPAPHHDVQPPELWAGNDVDSHPDLAQRRTALRTAGLRRNSARPPGAGRPAGRQPRHHHVLRDSGLPVASGHRRRQSGGRRRRDGAGLDRRESCRGTAGRANSHHPAHDGRTTGRRHRQAAGPTGCPRTRRTLRHTLPG